MAVKMDAQLKDLWSVEIPTVKQENRLYFENRKELIHSCKKIYQYIKLGHLLKKSLVHYNRQINR